MRVSRHGLRLVTVTVIVGLIGALVAAVPAGALDAPSITSINGGPAPDAMTLTWSAVSGATSYAYTYSTNSGSTYSGKIALGATSPKTVAVHVGCRYGDAVHGAACLFRIYARDGTGYSAASAP